MKKYLQNTLAGITGGTTAMCYLFIIYAFQIKSFAMFSVDTSWTRKLGDILLWICCWVTCRQLIYGIWRLRQPVQKTGLYIQTLKDVRDESSKAPINSPKKHDS